MKNPIHFIKKALRQGKRCVVAIAAKGSGSVAEAGVFPMQKFCLIIIENYDFIFRPPWICNWMRLLCPPMLFQGWMGRWCGGKQLGKREMFSAY